MLRKSQLAWSLLAVAALGGTAWSAHRSSFWLQRMGHEVFDTSWGRYARPAMAPPSDFGAFAEYLHKPGASLPTGFAIEDRQGRVRGALSGAVQGGTGERWFVLTVHDDAVDLDTATVAIDGQTVATATLANGGIEVRDSKALATLGFWLPASAPYSLQVDWSGTSAEPRSFLTCVASE